MTLWDWRWHCHWNFDINSDIDSLKIELIALFSFTKYALSVYTDTLYSVAFPYAFITECTVVLQIASFGSNNTKVNIYTNTKVLSPGKITENLMTLFVFIRFCRIMWIYTFEVHFLMYIEKPIWEIDKPNKTVYIWLTCVHSLYCCKYVTRISC